MEALQGPGSRRENGCPLPHPPFTYQSPGHRIGKITSWTQALPGSSHCHLLSTISTIVTPSPSSLRFTDLKLRLPVSQFTL